MGQGKHPKPLGPRKGASPSKLEKARGLCYQGALYAVKTLEIEASPQEAR